VVLLSFASLFSIRHCPCESQNIESDTLIILRSIEPWQRPASASRANLGRSNLNNRWHETAPPVGLPYPFGMLLLTGLALFIGPRRNRISIRTLWINGAGFALLSGLVVLFLTW
jgi:hypothetical protein